MFGTIWEILKKQRLAWAAAMIVAIVCLFVAHAPILPVLAGCALGMGISVLRAWPQHTRNPLVRGRR